MSSPLSLVQLMQELEKCTGSSRLCGRLEGVRVSVKTGKDHIRPVKLIGIDAGGSVLIVLEDEEIG